MIAHRLQTIMTAKNLLYIDSKNTMLAGTKGTPEYDLIMHKLQEESYKHQAPTQDGKAANKDGGPKEAEDGSIEENGVSLEMT